MSGLKDDQFYTVEHAETSIEHKVKGSRFIASVFHVRTKREAEDRYDRLCRKYHDASHNCFAYRIDEHVFRYSDNGEPAGTAGRQILRILERKNIHQVLIVVTRYFGGTKLGTGGLSRAYSDAAKQVLDRVKVIVKIKYKTISLVTDYDHMREILALVNKFNGMIGKTDYADNVIFSAQIPYSKFSTFQKEINSMINRGIVQFHLEDNSSANA
jgi:uncharacterized YigZ family protein